MQKKINERVQEYAADKIFVNRWSSRAMSGEILSHDELMNLFEAAKWAPSSYNSQPWRFIYVDRDSDKWASFFDLLNDFNKSWVNNASTLIILISKKITDYNKQVSTYSFDAGSAWQNIALQASIQGLVCRGVSGFNKDLAMSVANISSDYSVELMIAIGRPGSVNNLPDYLKDREYPSSRKKISEFVFKEEMK